MGNEKTYSYRVFCINTHSPFLVLFILPIGFKLLSRISFFLAWRALFCISYKTGLLAIDSLSFCLWISVSFWRMVFLDKEFFVYRILKISFNILILSFHCLLASIVSEEKLAIICIDPLLYRMICFSLSVFRIFCLWLSTVWLWCVQVWIDLCLSYFHLTELFGCVN